MSSTTLRPLRPLWPSAFSALNRVFNAQSTEVRKRAQRRHCSLYRFNLSGEVLRTLSQQDAGKMQSNKFDIGRHKCCSTSAEPKSDFETERERIAMPENGSINETTTGTTPGAGTTGTGTGTALSQTAQDYGQKISDVASQAKDYVSDKVSMVGDKFKELQNADLGELAENAKEYARQKPGQALLISAAAGLLLGLIIRGRR